MQTLIVSVVLLGLAVAVSSPTSVLAVLVILEMTSGVRRGVAFVVGWVATIAFFGVVLVLFPAFDFQRSQTTPSRAASVAELVIGVLAGRGFVTVDNGVATLTDLGRNILAWRGITSETAHALLGKVGQFGDVIKIRSSLREIAGLARTIMWSGTDEQKQKLSETRANLLTALNEAKASLHGALAEG